MLSPVSRHTNITSQITAFFFADLEYDVVLPFQFGTKQDSIHRLDKISARRGSRKRTSFHLLSRSFIKVVRNSATSNAAIAMSIVAISVASSPTAHNLATRSFTVM
jgi:hypothetical protein